MEQKIFVGRPDGLGNRIEEIMLLEFLAPKVSFHIVYIWQNPNRKDRSYPIHFETFNISIQLDSGLYLRDDTDEIKTILKNNKLDVKQMAVDGNRWIRPTFDIKFNTIESPLGLHIRGTDRISQNNNHPHFMNSQDEFNQYLFSSIELVNSLRPKFLYVCSDSPENKELIVRKIDNSITLVNPEFTTHISPEYIDFFALSLCSEVIMASKFSSFTFMASLIGNSKLHLFNYDEEVLIRYPVEAIYHPLKTSNFMRVKSAIKNIAKMFVASYFRTK
jgi:hypothetical protein